MDITKRKITKIAREVSRFTSKTLKADGVGSAEMDFIHVVRKNPGITQSEVVEKLGIDKGAAARQAASLQAKGYLVRIENESDHRSKRLYATELSESLKNSKAHIEARFYEWLAADMSEDDKNELARLIDIVYRRCKAESKAEFANIRKIISEEE